MKQQRAMFTPINDSAGPSTPEGRKTRGSSSRSESLSPNTVKKMVHRAPKTSGHTGTNEIVEITRESVLQQRAKHGLRSLIEKTMAAHKDPVSRAAVAKDALEVFAEAREVSDEGISRIWADYVEKEGLWDQFGGEEAFRAMMDYDNVIAPAQERYRATDGRKERARKLICEKWGDQWEEEFDPQEYRLRQFSEHFLRQLAAIARDGWSMSQAWKALDAGYRMRLQDRTSGQQKALVFMPKDVAYAKEWLTKAGEGKETKEEVRDEDLVLAWPVEVRPKQTKPKAAKKGKGKSLEKVVEEEESGAEEQDSASTQTPQSRSTEVPGVVVEEDEVAGRAVEAQAQRQQEKGKGKGKEVEEEEAEEEEIHKSEACGCGEYLSKAWGSNLRKYRSAEVVPLASQGKYLLDGVEAGLDNLCWEHLQRLASYVGLYVKRLNRAEMTLRLQHIHRQWDSIGNLHAAAATYGWFRKGARARVEADDLGSLLWKPIPWELPQFDRGEIFARFGSQEAWDAFLEKGNCVVPAFRWLTEETELWAKISEEFDLYLHHQRSDSTGWLRNCYHSVLQQAIRQDPVYYVLVLAARSDRAYRMLAFPHYAKYSLPGDYTQFRHIDLNPRKALDTGVGVNHIQTSLSLDQEIPEGCTAVVEGFQNHLADWWARVEARGDAKDGNSFRTTKTYLQEDEASFGKETNVVCAPGDLRISLPHLIHGATAGAKDKAILQRRTVNNWPTAIQGDGEAMEFLEMGSRADIAEAHRSLTVLPRNPTGQINAHSRPKARFASTPEVRGVWGIGDALLGMVDWESARVRWELEILLGADERKAWKLVRKVRRKLMEAMWEGYKVQEWAERRDFGPNSYFHARDTGTWEPPMRITKEGKESLLRGGYSLAGFGSDVESEVEDSEVELGSPIRKESEVEVEKEIEPELEDSGKELEDPPVDVAAAAAVAAKDSSAADVAPPAANEDMPPPETRELAEPASTQSPAKRKLSSSSEGKKKRRRK